MIADSNVTIGKIDFLVDEDDMTSDSAVKVYTDGLLGGRYLSLSIGYESDDLLKNGGVIEHTTSGLVLEDFLASAVNSMRGKDA